MFLEKIEGEKAYRLSLKGLYTLPADILRAYVYVAYRMYGGNEADVTAEDYARDCQVSMNTAQRQLKALAEYKVDGELLVVKGKYKTERGFSFNTYSRPTGKSKEDNTAQDCVDYFDEVYKERYGVYPTRTNTDKDVKSFRKILANGNIMREIKTTIKHYIENYRSQDNSEYPVPNIYFLTNHVWDTTYASANSYNKRIEAQALSSGHDFYYDEQGDCHFKPKEKAADTAEQEDTTEDTTIKEYTDRNIMPDEPAEDGYEWFWSEPAQAWREKQKRYIEPVVVDEPVVEPVVAPEPIKKVVKQEPFKKETPSTYVNDFITEVEAEPQELKRLYKVATKWKMSSGSRPQQTRQITDFDNFEYDYHNNSMFKKLVDVDIMGWYKKAFPREVEQDTNTVEDMGIQRHRETPVKQEPFNYDTLSDEEKYKIYQHYMKNQERYKPCKSFEAFKNTDLDPCQKTTMLLWYKG